MMGFTNKAGINIPEIGLGTFPFQGKILADMVLSAAKIGYRLFDTADDYRGEPGIGMALSELSTIGLSRDDLFIQTKISDNNAHADEPLKGIYFNPNSKFMSKHTVEEIVREKVYNSLHNLQTDYIDSILIHYPFPGYMVEIWKVLIKLKEEGVARFIGVSNFRRRHIEKLICETGVCPDINEVYISPIGTKESLVDYCNEHGCRLITYSPLMDVASKRLKEEPFQELMSKYNKSLAQIVLRWNLERGCLPLPKTKNPARLVENFDVFDFSLTKTEVEYISHFNIDYQYLVESKICPGL